MVGRVPRVFVRFGYKNDMGMFPRLRNISHGKYSIEEGSYADEK